jgi:ceramide glucosyltransferase
VSAVTHLPTWALPALLFLCACSAAYYLAVCLAAVRFHTIRQRTHEEPELPRSEWPPLSILKPVDGADPGFYENIRSHAQQDYPHFELLFAAADSDDPALEAVRRLAREFPQLRIEPFVCGSMGPGNRKAQLLEALEREARFEFLLVNDSDIRVEPGYLRDIAGAFLHPARGPRTGLVTCPYRARPGGTLPSLLEALAISAEFQSQVLLARLLRQVDFALGATMLFRRRDLQRIGGFRALVPYLADDYRLGNSITKLGLAVAISSHPVEIALGDDGWREVWRRQLRWSRTIRACRPAGHLSLFFAQGTVWSLLSLASLPGSGFSPLTAAIPGAALVLRLIAAWLVGWRCLGSAAVRGNLPRMFLADLLSFAAWLGSFFTRRVCWRNRLLGISRDGRILDDQPADAPLLARRATE